MAKSRSRSGAKKRTATRTPARRARATSKRSLGIGYGRPGKTLVELRPIRERLQADVERLGNAIAGRSEAQPQLEEALKRMSRWLADIQDICGPDMSIPL